MTIDAAHQRLIVIREEHSTDGNSVINTLAAVRIADGREVILDQGYDFYSSPTISPDGTSLAWLCWRHPNMPWVATHLVVAKFNAAGELSYKQLISGGDTESVFQPQWSPDNVLYYVSDRTDYWNLYRWNGIFRDHK